MDTEQNYQQEKTCNCNNSYFYGYQSQILKSSDTERVEGDLSENQTLDKQKNNNKKQIFPHFPMSPNP